MKLLSPAINKENKDQQNLRDILRTQETTKAAEKARKELASAEAAFSLTLARNREKWAKEEQEHADRIKEMSEELQTLEAKKSKALAPVELLKKQMEEKLQESTEYLAVLVKRDEETESLNEALQNKLDTIGQEEQDLKRDRQKFELEKQGIEQQKELTLQSSKKLSEEIISFNEVKKQAEKDIEERKTSVALLEAGLLSKEAVLKTTQEELTKEINSYNQLSQALATEKEEVGKSLAKGIDSNNEREAAVTQKESAFAEYKKAEEEKLEQRKTSVTLIESSLIAKDAGLKRKQLEMDGLLDSQRKQYKQVTEELEKAKQELETQKQELTKNREDFAIWKNKAEKLVEDKAMENSAKSKELEEKEQKLTEQEKFLSDWAIKLADQRGVLQRGLDELRRGK